MERRIPRAGSTLYHLTALRIKLSSQHPPPPPPLPCRPRARRSHSEPSATACSSPRSRDHAHFRRFAPHATPGADVMWEDPGQSPLGPADEAAQSAFADVGPKSSRSPRRRTTIRAANSLHSPIRLETLRWACPMFRKAAFSDSGNSAFDHAEGWSKRERLDRRHHCASARTSLRADRIGENTWWVSATDLDPVPRMRPDSAYAFSTPGTRHRSTPPRYFADRYPFDRPDRQLGLSSDCSAAPARAGGRRPW